MDQRRKDLMDRYTFYSTEEGLQATLMAFGFECGDGWIPLIEEMSEKIQDTLESRCPEHLDKFRILQVKEKFGTLRVYTNLYLDAIEDIIDEYVKLSSVTCEVCGNRGSLHLIRGWFSTLCDKHKKDMEDNAS